MEDAHKHADAIANRILRIKAAVGRNEPECGIWWYLASRQLLISSLPVSEAISYGDHLVGPTDHYRYWEQLRPHAPELRNLEYDQIPRGRVSFDVRSATYIILVGRQAMKSKKLIEAIKREFRLKNVPVRVENDDHYDI